MIVSKFDGDETYSSKWNAKVSSFRDFVTNKIAPLISLPVGTPAVSGNVGSLTGPDWSVGDMVPPIQNVLLRATATADFQSDNVFLILIHFQIHDSPIHDSFQFISQELGCWAHNLPALSDFFVSIPLLLPQAVHSEGHQNIANPSHHQGQVFQAKSKTRVAKTVCLKGHKFFFDLAPLGFTQEIKYIYNPKKTNNMKVFFVCIPAAGL